MISTVIIDAQVQDRNKTVSLLAAHNNIKVLGQGKDAYDALKLIGNLKPDIAILDNNLEFIEGEELPPLIKARSPSTAIVLLTAKISDYQLYRAVANAVSGFVHRKADFDTLPWILTSIHEGRCFISPSFSASILGLLSRAKWKSINRYHSNSKRLNTTVPPDNDPTACLSKTEL